MIIAFVHNNKAFLPGLYGYTQFFSRYGIKCEVVTPDELGRTHRNVEWYFLGTDLSKPKEGIYKIHEYSSASLPPFRKWKDWVKSFMNAQPDYRLFQNEFVKNCMKFHDSIPWGYRDLGVPEEWLKLPPNLPKEYDFIYIGDTSVKRNMKTLFNKFTEELRDRSLLVLSHRYEELQQEYKAYSNIFFKGPVQKHQVREYLLKSKFAINYITNIEPFNQQTSTKLLEYISCRVPVITTDYNWMRIFEQQNGGRYFYLDKNLENFNWSAVNDFSYDFPDLSEWTWEKQIRKSGVLHFLEANFPELKF
jgi:glycosyltransferase involved in cell wall biosynthesis